MSRASPSSSIASTGDTISPPCCRAFAGSDSGPRPCPVGSSNWLKFMRKQETSWQASPWRLKPRQMYGTPMNQGLPLDRTPRSVPARIALLPQDEDTASRRRSIVAKLTYSVGRDPIVVSDHDWFVATTLAVRDRVVERWVPATCAAYSQGRKRVYYLSLEFLIGRLLFDSLN